MLSLEGFARGSLLRRVRALRLSGLLCWGLMLRAAGAGGPVLVIEKDVSEMRCHHCGNRLLRANGVSVSLSNSVVCESLLPTACG